MTMRYQNGITYTFHVGKSVAYVRFHNYGPQAVENFNRALGREILKAFEKEAGPYEKLGKAYQRGEGQKEGSRTNH